MLNDDGPIELKTGAAAESSADQGGKPTIVGEPGIAPAGAQAFSPAPPKDGGRKARKSSGVPLPST